MKIFLVPIVLGIIVVLVVFGVATYLSKMVQIGAAGGISVSVFPQPVPPAATYLARVCQIPNKTMVVIDTLGPAGVAGVPFFTREEHQAGDGGCLEYEDKSGAIAGPYFVVAEVPEGDNLKILGFGVFVVQKEK